MSKLDTVGNEQYVFGSLFVVANKLDTLLERELKQFDMTAKQWYLSIVIDTLFDEPPTLKEAAKAMGSTHQNVKQVALKLEAKGYLKLQRDSKDARVTRLILTEENSKFWEKTHDSSLRFMKTVFDGILKEELSDTREVLSKIWANLGKIEDE